MYSGIDFLDFKCQTVTSKNMEILLKDIVPNSEQASNLHEQDICANTSSFELNGNYKILLPIITSASHAHLYHPQLFVFCESNARYYTTRANYRSYMLLFTHSGQGMLKYMNQEYVLNPGDGFLIDCIQKHHYYTKSSPWIHSDLHFVGGASDDLYRTYLEWESPLFHDEVSGGLQILLEKLAVEWNNMASYRYLRVSNAIGELLTYILMRKSLPENADSRYDAVRQAACYLESHFAESIDLSLLAQKYAVSKYHLSHDFKRYFGVSPIQYLIRFRIEHAKYLLMNTNLPIHTIASVVGIPDLNNFTNHFRKNVMMTPSAYRKTHLL